MPTNPYHAFYQKRVADFKEGEGDAGAPPAKDGAEGEAAGAAAAAPAEPEAVTVIRTKDLEKPEPEKYTVRVPEGLSAQDIDVIKLAAQFVARNGKGFLQELAAKEAKNPAFGFLRPTHSLHPYFTGLADAYARVLLPPKAALAKVAGDATDATRLLERCLRRLEYDKALDREREEAREEQERERAEMHSIDWHDFVVVETIEFFPGEDLPPPVTLGELLQVRRAQDALLGEGGGADGDDGEDGGAGAGGAPGPEMDAEEAALVAGGAALAAGAGGEAPGPGGPRARAPGQVQVVDDAEDAPRRVVRDYRREIEGQGKDATQYVVSPLTGELVPIRDMEEHMRISLIDPRWREQREAMLGKMRDSTKAGDEEITANLMTLAQTRPDIFATTETELQGVLADAIDARKTSGTHRPVAWDGVSKGRAAAEQQREAEEQRAAGQVRAFPRVHNPARPRQGPAGPGDGDAPEEPAPKKQRT